MLTIKKKAVTATIQTALIAMRAPELNPRMGSTWLATASRAMFTMCVKGKTDRATTWAANGKEVNGKKVPVKKNIGVKKRNVGKLKKSIFGATAVKHMAMEENIKPPKNAIGIMRMKNAALKLPRMLQ